MNKGTKTPELLPKLALRTLALLVAMLSAMSSFAYDFEVNGIYYSRVYGNENEVSVTYRDFEGNSYSGDVSIPETVFYGDKTYSVTAIEGLAFQGCSELLSVSLPNTIIQIRYQAFEGCTGLKSIVIPNSVTLIEQAAFMYCTGLTSIEFPVSLTTIDDQAFFQCSNLSSISAPSTLTYIGSYAFDGTLWLKNQPNGMVYLGQMFYKYKGTMPSNTSISLREGTVGIAGNAFAGCNGLVDIQIPNGVVSIGSTAFSSCWRLTSITLPSTVVSIGSSAFSGCSGLTEMLIPDSVKVIPYGAFSNCSGLTHLVLGNSLALIDMNSFIECLSLTNLDFPSSLKRINPQAFWGCKNLASVSFGDSIEYIGDCAFWGCVALSFVNISNLSAWCNINFEYDTSNPIYYSHSLYLNNQEVKDLVIPEDVTNINSYAFNNCSELKSLTINRDNISIGAVAFNGCDSLTDVTCLANNPPTIYKYTFNNTIYSNATLHVRRASVPIYSTANYWKEFSNIEALPEINMVILTDTASLHGNTLVIPVSLENESEITAFQTDLYLPEGFELVKEDGDYLVELSDRKGRDHVIMANDLDDGGIRIISYSTSIKPFSGNEGELFYITIKTPDDGDGDYTLQLKNTLLTTTDKEELNAPDASCTVTVYPYIQGDANNSGTVTVTDVVTAARYILNYHPDPFVFGAADMNNDGSITVTDVVLIAELIMNGSPSTLRLAPAMNHPVDRMSGEVINSDSNRYTVAIKLDNAAAYTAFQLDLQLPDGMTADNFTLTAGSSSHALDVNLLDNGKTRLLCYEPTLKALNGDEQTLLTFDVTADAVANRDIIVDGIEMVSNTCQCVNLDAFVIKMDNVTSVDELTANVRIYSDGHNIIVESPIDVAVNVSDLLGRTTVVTAKAGRTVIPTDGKGLYIVNAAGAVAKLMLK